MFEAIRAWFVVTFCYTLTVPEYKGFHVAKTADDDSIASMCHVFDGASYQKLTAQLPKLYLHVIAWDADGAEVFRYDNR